MNESIWHLVLSSVLAQTEAPAETATLTSAGWTVMISSITVVILLVSYCLIRVFSLPPVDMEEIKGPLEIDTGDTADAD